MYKEIARKKLKKKFYEIIDRKVHPFFLFDLYDICNPCYLNQAGEKKVEMTRRFTWTLISIHLICLFEWWLWFGHANCMDWTDLFQFGTTLALNAMHNSYCSHVDISVFDISWDQRWPYCHYIVVRAFHWFPVSIGIENR